MRSLLHDYFELSKLILSSEGVLQEQETSHCLGLDSPIGFVSDFLGKGTTNLPLSAREWWSWKWCLSSRERVESLIGFSSISQNFLSISSPDRREVW